VILGRRGLAESVILNIGLTAGLIDPTTFTAFLAMALITTAATGPVTSLLGPCGKPSGYGVGARGRSGADTFDTERVGRG
jgi:hypothetical protein